MRKHTKCFVSRLIKKGVNVTGDMILELDAKRRILNEIVIFFLGSGRDVAISIA